jgi:DNA (cytosine-5)-methyltransferase 1
MNSVPVLSAENLIRIKYLFDHDLDDLPNHVRPDCHKEGTTYKSVYGRMRWDLPAPTITTGFLSPGRGRYVHPRQQRVITPHEAARIQFFPDTYSFTGAYPEAPSRNLLSKWIGDAVPPLLGYAAAMPLMTSLARV